MGQALKTQDTERTRGEKKKGDKEQKEKRDETEGVVKEGGEGLCLIYAERIEYARGHFFYRDHKDCETKSRGSW